MATSLKLFSSSRIVLINVNKIVLRGTVMFERSRALVAVREIRGSNPVTAYLDLFFGPNFSGGIASTTHIERTFREASA